MTPQLGLTTLLLLMPLLGTLWLIGHTRLHYPDEGAGWLGLARSLRLSVATHVALTMLLWPAVAAGYELVTKPGLWLVDGLLGSLALLFALVTPLSMVASGVFLKLRHTEFRDPSGLCAACYYDLRGNTSGRCPECGSPSMPSPEQFGSGLP